MERSLKNQWLTMQPWSLRTAHAIAAVAEPDALAMPVISSYEVWKWSDMSGHPGAPNRRSHDLSDNMLFMLFSFARFAYTCSCWEHEWVVMWTNATTTAESFPAVGISLVTLFLSRLCLSFCLACASVLVNWDMLDWSLLQGFYCQIRCKRLFFGVTLQVWHV